MWLLSPLSCQPAIYSSYSDQPSVLHVVRWLFCFRQSISGVNV